MTAKLFYADTYLRSFEATVIQTGIAENGTSFAILDQTAFYPTGGGQPCDLGTLMGIAVTEVEEVNGQIIHKLASPLADSTERVRGEIDWARRFDHMQQHSGQHILSASFEEIFNAETFGFHMGRHTVTVDINKWPMSEADIQAVEQLANRIVFENRSVTAACFTTEELALVPLRKPPTVTENIRIVTIDGFDYSACGGTHPQTTAEVGLIKVLSWDKHKSGARVEFVCGGRALYALEHKQQILRHLGRLLGTGENELADSARKLLDDRRELNKALQDSKKLLWEHEAKEMIELSESIQNVHVCLSVFNNRPIQDMQQLAMLVTANSPNQIALLVSVGEKTNLVFAKGQDVNMSMTDLLKSVLPLIDGKGGGSKSIAQGGGHPTDNPHNLLQEALRLVKERL